MYTHTGGRVLRSYLPTRSPGAAAVGGQPFVGLPTAASYRAPFSRAQVSFMCSCLFSFFTSLLFASWQVLLCRVVALRASSSSFVCVHFWMHVRAFLHLSTVFRLPLHAQGAPVRFLFLCARGAPAVARSAAFPFYSAPFFVARSVVFDTVGHFP